MITRASASRPDQTQCRPCTPSGVRPRRGLGRGGGEVQGARHVIGARSPEQQPRRRQRARREHLGLAVADAQGDREGLGGELFTPLQLGAVHHRQPAAQLEDPGQQALVVGGLDPPPSRGSGRHRRSRSTPGARSLRHEPVRAAPSPPTGRPRRGRWPCRRRRRGTTRGEGAAEASGRVGRRRHAHAVPGEVGRQRRRAAAGGAPGGGLQLGGDLAVGPVARQGQVAGPGVGVVDHIGEPGVQRLALQRIERGEHRRRQQWVGEAHHEVVADGEHTLVDRLGDPAHGIGIAAGAGDRRRRRRPERGGDAQHVAQPGGRPGEAARQRRTAASAGPTPPASRRSGRRPAPVRSRTSGCRPTARRSVRGPAAAACRRAIRSPGGSRRSAAARGAAPPDGRPAGCDRPVGATGRAARWPAPAPAHGRGAERRSAALRPTPDRATGRRRSPPRAVSSTRAGARRRGPAARARTGRRRRPACPHSRRCRRTGRPAPRSEPGSSSSVARVTSVPAPALRPRCSAHRHSDVLPMPASPRTTTTRDPRAIPLTSAASRSTSRSRPTNEGSGGATIGCTVTVATVPQPSRGRSAISAGRDRTAIWSLAFSISRTR